MGREVPAVTAVIRMQPSPVEIYACASHIAATIRELGSKDLELRPANPDIHGCKGCWADWPA